MRYEKFMQNTDHATHANATAVVIQEVAQRLFLKQGYKETTLRDIAEAAGVTLSLIPYHFVSKEELAKKIFYEMREEKYRHIMQCDMSALTNAERLYVISILIWQDLDSDPEYAHFFYALLETTDVSNHPSNTFRELAASVISQYGLDVSEHENALYQSVLMGAEHHLILGRYHGRLHVSNAEIANMLISNYMFNVGVSDNEIAKIITNSTEFLKRLHKQG